MTAPRHRTPQHGLIQPRVTRAGAILSALIIFTLLFSPLLPLAVAAPAAEPASLLLPPQATEATWTVCASACDFTTIGAALADGGVLAGDTIVVMDAVHTELGIYVDKDINIRGLGAGETIVQGSEDPMASEQSGAVFTIGHGVRATIADMTVRHGIQWAFLEFLADIHEEQDDGDVVASFDGVQIVDIEAAGIVVRGNLTLDRSVVADNFVRATTVVDAQVVASAPLTATASAEVEAISVIESAGAGIYNQGALTVTQSTVAGNNIYADSRISARAVADGGVITQTASVIVLHELEGAGIYNRGAMWLINSTVSGNNAESVAHVYAGHDVIADAVHPAPGGTDDRPANAAVYHIEDTAAATLYAAWDENGQRELSDKPDWPLPEAVDYVSESLAMVMSNSTGGIFNIGTATIRFSTISGNGGDAETDVSAAQAITVVEETGGLYSAVGPALALNNSIVARQAAGSDCSEVAGTGGGYNMDSDGSCSFYGSGELSNADVMLGPLEDNGGPTPTHALLFGSAGVDAADPACSDALADQRGETRAVDGDGDSVGRCDIGAVESTFQADVAVQGAVAGQTQVVGQPGNTFTLTPGEVTAGARLTYTLAVENHGPRASESIAQDLHLEFLAPEALQATGATIGTTQGSCDAALPVDRDDPLVCDLGMLAPGDIVTVTVGARVDPALLDGDTLQGESTVLAVPEDPQLANNVTAMLATTGRHADVAVSNVQAPHVAFLGQAVTYTVGVENVGPSDAANVDVTDVLPAVLEGASWTCATWGGAACPQSSGNGDVEQHLALPTGTGVTFTISSQVNFCTSFETTASASGETDPYADNDSASTSNELYCTYLMPLMGSGGAPAP